MAVASVFISSRRSMFEEAPQAAPTPATHQQKQQVVFRQSRSRSEKNAKNSYNSLVRTSQSENCSRVGTPSSTTSSFCGASASVNGVSGSVSRRRSMSPLFTPIIGPNGHLTPAMLERNMMDPNFPQTEDECLYMFHERIIWNQEKSLLPLAHDLADWLNSLLEIPYITPSNLMEKLESGLILCQLAKHIEEKAYQCCKIQETALPKLKGKLRYNAPVGSFFARDNIAIFINFCKELGVHSNLLFETEDLVSHGEIRNVLVCLLEVGRKAAKYGVEPPMLVTLEHQIDNELAADSQHETGTTNTTTDEDSQDDEINKENSKRNNLVSSGVQAKLLSDSIDSGLHVEEDTIPRPTELVLRVLPKKSVLDIKVNEVAMRSETNCHCLEDTRANFKLRKLSEGKYVINGRTVFVRLLKSVHVMVRVGGGWETLEEFLVRNDPCRTRRPRPASAASTPLGVSTFKQPFGYRCSNNSRDNMNTVGVTPRSMIPVYRKGRPVSSPPVMMSKPASNSRPVSGNFSGSATPLSSKSKHSSRSSVIT